MSVIIILRFEYGKEVQRLSADVVAILRACGEHSGAGSLVWQR